jgi:hypothetical protein
VNPIKSKSFTASFVLYRSIPGLALFATTFIWPETGIYAAAAFSLIASLVWIFWDARKLPLILIASFLFTQGARAADKPKNPGAVCAVVVVVIIGGYCYYKVVKACQNLKPRVLPDEDESTNAPAKSASEINVAMSQDLPPSYCCAGEEKSGRAETSVELEVNGGLLAIRPFRAPELVPEDDFETLLIREGFDPNKTGVQFSRNHRATEYSPITFTEEGVTIAGENQRQITIQKSEDLAEWTNLAQITIPSGTRLFITDASDQPSRFYRIAK